MSISTLPPLPALPLGGPIPSTSSTTTQPLSAAVTRILTLTKFSPDLKTRDIQAIFSPWYEEKGGFKIKWIDDVTALAVFADATVAKKAYLSLIWQPSPLLPPPASIRPYDGPDAQSIIHSVNARAQGHGTSSSIAVGRGSISGGVKLGGRESFSGGTSGGHIRSGSMSTGNRIGSSNNGVLNSGFSMPSSTGSHGRSNSLAAGTTPSWSRSSVSGVFSGFNNPSSSSSSMPPPTSTNPLNLTKSRLETYQEQSEFDPSAAPTQARHDGGRSGTFERPLDMPSWSNPGTSTSGGAVYHHPTFARSSSSASDRTEDSSTSYSSHHSRTQSQSYTRGASAGNGNPNTHSPAIDVLGGMVVAEGGPGGIQGLGPFHSYNGPRSISGGSTTSSGSGHGRRKSSAPGGAEKALESIRGALAGLGVSAPSE